MRTAIALVPVLFLASASYAAPLPGELTEEDLARLGNEKVLVGRQTFPSVTVPYKTDECPVFLTSDSVLAALHSLLEEATGRLEWARGQALRKVLAAMQAKLPTARERFDLEGDLLDRSERRARVVLATARLLLGDRAGETRPEIFGPAYREAARVEAAKAVGSVPRWYGPPEPGFSRIDYSRFRPTGSLALVPETARTARALGWLSFVPFRVERDEELLAFLLLAACSEGVTGADRALGDLPGILEPGEDPCLADAPELPEVVKAADFTRLRKELRRRGRGPRIRDLTGDPGSVVPVTARILPLSAPSDSVLLQRLSDRRTADREDGLPTALAIAAAVGSEGAGKLLGEGDRAVVGEARKAGFARGKSLSDRYLRCLSLLLGPLPKRAPDLFSCPAWRTKSLQTALSGFTLWRHAFDLRIKDGSRVFGRRDAPGFLEPAPRFFKELGAIVAETGRLLEAGGRESEAYEHLVQAAIYEAAAEAIAATPLAGEGKEAREAYWRRLGEEAEKIPLLAAKGSEAYMVFSRALQKGSDPDKGPIEPRTETARERCVRWLRDAAKGLRSGRRRASKTHRMFYSPIPKRFERLAALLNEMSRLAKRQLMGRPFTKEEERWIRNFGQELSLVTGEGDNPTDDAPAAVSVFTDPARGLHLVQAVGRPRALWVLYPWEGEEVLCRGAVLPWYELALRRAPTDLEWKAMLDAEEPPTRPPAMRKIYAE